MIEFKCGTPVEKANKLHHSLYKDSDQIYAGATAICINEKEFVLLVDGVPLLYNSQIFKAVLPVDVEIDANIPFFRLQVRPLSDMLVRVQIGFNSKTRSVHWEFDVNNQDLAKILNKICHNKPLDKVPSITVMGDGMECQVITLTKEVQDV